MKWRAAPDSWLAQHLDRPAFRVSASAEGIDAADVARELGTGFGWARVSAKDVPAVTDLEHIGFGVVDCGLSFEREAPEDLEPHGEPDVRDARADDAEAVCDLAARAFVNSRFHLDPRIERVRANAIKRAWAQSYFNGTRGDGMVVSLDADARVSGFLLWLHANDAVVVDLVAVDEHSRGGACAARLTHAAWRAAGTPRVVRVGTQAANVRATRVYTRLHFLPVAADFVLHYHGV